jgi:cytochrome c5
MKSSLLTAAVLALIIYSCAPKVKVTAMQPDPVQVPPKIASVEEEKPIHDEMAEGKSLYENVCNRCHGLYKPTDFTKEQWGPIIASMQIKAGIDNEQTAKIYNYITTGLD